MDALKPSLETFAGQVAASAASMVTVAGTVKFPKKKKTLTAEQEAEKHVVTFFKKLLSRTVHRTSMHALSQMHSNCCHSLVTQVAPGRVEARLCPERPPECALQQRVYGEHQSAQGQDGGDHSAAGCKNETPRGDAGDQDGGHQACRGADETHPGGLERSGATDQSTLAACLRGRRMHCI